MEAYNLNDLAQQAAAGTLTLADLKAIPRDERLKLAHALQQQRSAIQQENQLLFYRPVSDEAKRFHCSAAQQRVILGGNGSSKSESQLVDLVIEMTGIVPYSLEAIYPKSRLRAPIHARLIVQDFTNTWEGSIKDKLIYTKWTGLADGIRGHWGWIPKHLLLKGSFDESWSEKYRTLTLTNGSTLQIMSHDQDVQAMASASLHRIGVDEGPSSFEWRENLMRLREGGSISLAMTPPDDESKSWNAAWVYDDLYERGKDGPNKDPDIESFNFNTQKNPFIDQEALAKATKNMTEDQKATRLGGAFMHLGGLVYKTYTDVSQFWCFTCNAKAFLVDQKCGKCHGDDVCEYCNLVEPDPRYYQYPVVWYVDPHPRKPVMMVWIAVDPYDDSAQVAELEVDGAPELVAMRAFDLEREMGLNVVARVMDAKMKGQAAHNAGKRGVSVGDAFDQVGLRCKGANNDFYVGKNRLGSLIEPDRRTKRPRLVVFNTCKRTNYMMRHFVWDERVNQDGHDQKQTPRAYNDDFPALLRYHANEDFTYQGLIMGMIPHSATKRKRRSAYG